MKEIQRMKKEHRKKKVYKKKVYKKKEILREIKKQGWVPVGNIFVNRVLWVFLMKELKNTSTKKRQDWIWDFIKIIFHFKNCSKQLIGFSKIASHWLKNLHKKNLNPPTAHQSEFVSQNERNHSHLHRLCHQSLHWDRYPTVFKVIEHFFRL